MNQNCAIAILNYNGKKHLETFLPSLIRFSNDARIYVIDNASTDNSVSFLKNNYSDITIVELEKNRGFAGGYNKGLEKINEEIIVLLNSDIEVTNNWLTPCVELLTSNELIVACQPKILSFVEKNKFEHAGASGGFIDRFGFPFCRGRIFETAEVDTQQYNSVSEIFWASGACFFVKRKAFFEAGGFDDDFFAHMEEIDLCWRFKKLGYSIYVNPDSTVYHLGGGTLNYKSPFKTKLNFRNNLYLLQKNLTKNRFWIMLVRLKLDGIAGMKFFFTGYWKHTGAIVKAHFEFYRSIRKTRKKRTAFDALIKSKNSNEKKGKYNKSIVLDYYLRRKKKFSALKIKD